MVKQFTPEDLEPSVFKATERDHTIDCRALIAALLSNPSELARRADVLPLARRVLTAEAEVKRLRTALGAIFAGEIAHRKMLGSPQYDFITGQSPVTRAMADFPDIRGEAEG